MEQILDISTDEKKTAVYAGFWIRVVAYLIDGIILGVAQSIIMFSFLGSFFFNIQPGEIPDGAFFMKLGFVWILVLIVQWLYFAGMESSSRQATVGKLALGIVVTDLNGDRVSFAQASGRFFSKIISALVMCIGFLMVGFSEKKQGLHDLIARTYVVKK
jgi:uncharacterized RDD family membrane protein YckC